MADLPDPFAFGDTTRKYPPRIVKSDADMAPPGRANPEFRDVLLGPIRKAMAEQERNAQVMPGPSSVGGCEKKLAWQILFPDQFVNLPSGWSAMKGTVLHEWYDGLCKREGWTSGLALPQSVQSITGGTLDLHHERTIVDLKAPGTYTIKEAKAGRVSVGYYDQTQVYGKGAAMLGLPVDSVGLLFVPMCGDDLNLSQYVEWDYDPDRADMVLANAERIRALGEVVPDRMALLNIMATKSDFCGASCPVFDAGHCAGHTG